MNPLSRKSLVGSPSKNPPDGDIKRAKIADSSNPSDFSEMNLDETGKVFLGKTSEKSRHQTEKLQADVDLCATHTRKDPTAKFDISSGAEPRPLDTKELYLEQLNRIDEKIERDRAARRAQIMSGAPRPEKLKIEIPQPPDLTEVLADYLKSLPPRDPTAVVVPPALTRFPPLESFLPPEGKNK